MDVGQFALEFEHEVEDTEEVVDKFKDFLDQVTPGWARGDDRRGGDRRGGDRRAGDSPVRRTTLRYA